MTRLTVHVERVVLHGVAPMPPEALAAAIETELRDALMGQVPPPQPAAQPPGPAAQVGRAVAPAVLSAAGMKPPPRPGGRP